MNCEREPGDPEMRTLEGVCALHVARTDAEDVRELAGMLRDALGHVAPWRRQAWAKEEDTGVAKMAALLYRWGVRAP